MLLSFGFEVGGMCGFKRARGVGVCMGGHYCILEDVVKFVCLSDIDEDFFGRGFYCMWLSRNVGCGVRIGACKDREALKQVGKIFTSIQHIQRQ